MASPPGGAEGSAVADQRSSKGHGAGDSVEAQSDAQARSVRRLVRDPEVFAHLSDIVAVYDRQMRFLWLSRAVAPLDPNALVGLCVLDNIAPEDREGFARAFDETWETGKPTVVEARDLQGNWWATRLARVLGPDGVAHMLGAVVDITSRKRVELALAERDERLRAAVEASGVGTWTWHRESDQLVPDESLCRILGIVPGAAPARFREYLGYVVAEDHARVAGLMQRALREGVFDDCEHRVRRAGGEVRHVLSRGSAIVDGEGRVTGLRGGVFDITERKQLEEQLRQVQRMDAIGQLTAGIAHNFNNLLTVILPNVDLCREGATAEASTYLDDIEQAAERAMEMVRQLMRMARHEVGTRKVPTDLVALAHRTQHICRSTFDRNVEIDLASEPDLPPVLASPGDIEQVLLNICMNARDALEESHTREPRISIEVERGQVAAKTVRVRVRDNGPGIDEALRARVFEPFFTTKPVGRGTGLGLASAYGIITEHRGTIACESTPGHGATFTVELPVASTLPDAERTPVEEIPGRGGESILIVDDESLVRRTLRAVLEHGGYRVVEACDGAEALSVLADPSNSVDLVLLDRSMPNMRGEEFLARVTRTGTRVPIILFTGEPMDDTVDLPGVSAVMLKPVKTADLHRKVRQVLDAGHAQALGSDPPRR